MSSEGFDQILRFVIAGRLNRDTILPISGAPQVDVLGGNLPYAAVGLNLWGDTAGLMAKVDADYPIDWLGQFASRGFDLQGIKVSPDPVETRRFIAHIDSTTTHYQNPVQHFADRGLSFPKNLLGFNPDQPNLSSRTTPSDASIRISDIPKHYLEASAVHICPIDFVSHRLLPSIFHQGQATTITLSPDPGYMSPSFWEEIPSLLSELTAFITSEADIRNLFQGRKTDLWEMAAVLANFGPEFILIQTTTRGVYLLDRINEKRWVVPDYPAQTNDPTGASDAFAGGFLAGYRRYYDPLEAALMGSIAASFVMEGSGAYYALNAMPRLIELRLEALRDLVREIN
jgi:sugar/nucleoside kinase (ribokinase family)